MQRVTKDNEFKRRWAVFKGFGFYVTKMRGFKKDLSNCLLLNDNKEKT